MSGSARDVQLIIRARNEVRQTIGQVAQNVAELTQRLNEQVAAASKAEVTYQELLATQQALGRQDSNLLKQASSIALFKDLSARLDEQTAKAAQSRAAYNALALSLDGVAKKTKEQRDALTQARAAANADDTKVGQTAAALQRQSDKLKEVGVDVQNLNTAERQLFETTEALGRALKAAGEATAGFGAQQRAIRQTKTELDALATSEQKAKAAADARAATEAKFQANLAAGRQTLKEIEYTKLFSATLDELDAKEKALAASNALAEKARKDEEAAARSLAAFRALADNATRLSGGLQTTIRPAASVGSEASVAAAVERIVAPAQAARRTLQGLQGQIDTLTAASAAGGRPIQEYADLLRGLEQAQRALGAQGAAIDAFKAQVTAVGQSRASFNEAREAARGYAAQIASATKEDAALARSLREAQEAMARFDAETRRGVARAQDLRQALAGAGIDSRKLAEAEAVLLVGANKVAPAMTKLAQVVRQGVSPGGPPTLFGLRPYQLQNLGFQINDVFTQIASGTSVTQTLAQQGGQILQIFPGAFSAIARLAPALFAVGIPLAAFVAGITRLVTLQGALREFRGALQLSADGATYQAASLVKSQQALRDYGAGFDEAGKALRVFVEAQVSPQRIDAFARSAQNLSELMGVKLPEAAKLVADAFTKDGDAIYKLNQQYNFLTETQGKQIADALREGDINKARTIAFEAWAEAVQRGADAARGPWSDSVKAFKQEWNSLLDTLANSGVAIGGLKLLEAAISGVTGALRGASVEEKLKTEGAAIGALTGELNRLQQQQAASRAAGVGQLGGFDDNRRIAQLTEEIKKRSAALLADTEAFRRNESAQASAGGVAQKGTGAIKGSADALQGLTRRRDLDNDATQQELVNAPRVIERLRQEALGRVSARDATAAQIKAKIELAGLEARAKAQSDGAPVAVQIAAQVQAEIAEKKKLDAELGRIGAAAAEREKAKAEELMNYLHKLEAGNTKFLEGELDDRLRAFDESIKRMRERIADFAKGFKGTIEGLPIDEFRRRFEAAVAAARQLEQVKFLGDGLKTLSSEASSFANSVGDQVKRGTLDFATALDLLRKNAEAAGPQMVKLAQQTVALTDKMIAAGKINPLALLQRQIAQNVIATQGATENGAGTREQDTVRVLEAGMARINQLLETRKQIVQEQTLAVTEGATSQSAAEAAIKAAYEGTNAELTKLVESMKTFARESKDAGAIGDVAFGLWEAKLRNVSQQVQYITPEMKTLVAAIRTALPEAGSEFFRTVTTSIGAAIAGTKSWAETFRDVKVAMLNFFASFLSKIAEAILQAQLLKLATSLFGGTPFGDLLGLGSGAGGAAGGAASIVESGGFTLHTGGIVGASNTQQRSMPAAWFASAPRFHRGGFPGLDMNEVAIVAKKGEEVLSEKDPRNALNGGLSPGGRQAPINIRSVLVADPSFVPSQMASAAGERTIMSVLRNNAATLREIVR